MSDEEEPKPVSWLYRLAQLGLSIAVLALLWPYAFPRCPYSTYEEFIAAYQEHDYRTYEECRNTYVDWIIPELDRVITKTFYETKYKGVVVSVWPRWSHGIVPPIIPSQLHRVRGRFGGVGGTMAIQDAKID
jgi:hypothetical protein